MCVCVRERGDVIYRESCLDPRAIQYKIIKVYSPGPTSWPIPLGCNGARFVFNRSVTVQFG